ncbi:MAG: NADH-quinone oxidoreductase subunit NuoH [Deltaproteobacteria bacterium]|nr:MAG: NADH-quinone oxidoreductase subunit NuoH [Deltaproteobacteria bacterium]
MGVIFFVSAAVLVAITFGGAWLFGIGGTEWVGLLNFIGLHLLFVMVTATLLVLAERKWSARIQNRVGPNRARLTPRGGPLYGLPHLIADSVKMLVKEDFVPPEGTRWLFNLAPVLAFAPAFALMCVVPVAPPIEAFGTEVFFQVARLDMGLLYLFAISSIAVYGTALAGWASNNKFGLLGGLRASAQMVSYEVALALTVVGVVLLFGSVAPDEIAAAQDTTRFGLPNWGVIYQPIALVLFFTAAAAEIKRAPFDLPEGESEIIGYFVEYSGMKFGLFMIAEFAEIVVLAALITVLFFGGWSIPWLPFDDLLAMLQGSALGPDLGALVAALVAVFVFLAKTLFFVWLQMMVRWTFPRFRWDQVMDLGWKMLLPLSLGNVVLTAVLVALDPSLDWAFLVGLVELVLLAGVVLTTAAPEREEEEHLRHRMHADLRV